MPAERLKALFELGVSFRESGTGIGLATLKAIVESYGSRIWAEHTELGGTEV